MVKEGALVYVLGATTRKPHKDLDSSFSPTLDLLSAIFPFKVTHDREAPHQQGGQENGASSFCSSPGGAPRGDEAGGGPASIASCTYLEKALIKFFEHIPNLAPWRVTTGHEAHSGYVENCPGVYMYTQELSLLRGLLGAEQSK